MSTDESSPASSASSRARSSEVRAVERAIGAIARASVVARRSSLGEDGVDRHPANRRAAENEELFRVVAYSVRE